MSRLWTEQLDGLDLPKLTNDVKTDVAIVGGGITGLVTAYLLAKAGKKVVVLEKGSIGTGETGSTTAFVTLVPDVDLSELKRRFGNAKTAQVLRSGERAIELIGSIVADEKIECEFVRCSAHVFAARPGDADVLKEEAHLAKQCGFTFAFHEGEGFEKHGCLEVKGQAKFHPGKFLAGLAAAIQKRGGKIYANTAVTAFKGKHGTTLVTPGGKVTCADVVVATHAQIDNRVETSARVTGFQSYVIAASAAKGAIAEAVYWDTAEPYHYFRVDPGPTEDRIILGGEDHKTGRSADPDAAYKRLEAYLQKILRGAKAEVTHRWSGQVIETIDKLPYIGRSMFNRRHYIATGFAGNGMAFGAISAMVISDQILGKKNAWEKLYTPKRLRGLVRWTAVAVGSIAQVLAGYGKILFTSKKGIRPGQGKVVTMKGRPVALSKSGDGKLIAVSAVCTHLGCLVCWNDSAKTWDCPCHGSRFKATGEVINGPAVQPLERIPPPR